ncbi:hypothetical protein AGOR_G00066290 [Albula goreensis]|uniref:PDZ domain-containing protein n=1 Tax=Albula goreensis TaxID=1534307 RepID=A0A8T3DWU7_9TELE|nr:hypothetical protein AGOR_G00066290 [Albula goreensis]
MHLIRSQAHPQRLGPCAPGRGIPFLGPITQPQGDREMAVPKPKVINLSKREGQSFGFFLRMEQGEEGHLIRNLEMGGPAELAGMKDGDRILRVNGTFVDVLDHSQVVDMVKGSGTTVTFHILDQASYKQAKATGIDLSDPHPRPAQTAPIMNGVAGSTLKPKLCFLVKARNGYGFSLKSTRGERGVYMTDVTPAGVADKAGVKAKDRIVEVNGENVDNTTHEQIVEKVKASGGSVMFLLADEETDNHYRNKKVRLGAGMATVKYLPHKPRIADMTKGSDGYGFFLRADPNIEGHIIKDIDSGSPAERAGLKDMDRLMAVNGEDVNNMDHNQVVDRIRQCGDSCSLLVIDNETDKMYKMGELSPLLYWDEMRGSLPQLTPPASPEPVPPAAEPSPTPPPASARPIAEDYKPKLCKLEKTAAGFGFHLNGIQGVAGQYIKEVVKGGAADMAGLEDDDIVIEVGGVNVEDRGHEEVVEMIRKSGSSLVLLVAGRRAYDRIKAKKVPVAAPLLAEASLDTPAATQEEVKEEEEAQNEEQEESESEKEAEDGDEEKEAEQKEVEQEEVEQKEVEQEEVEQKEAEQKEAEQKEVEQKEAEQGEVKQKEVEQKEAEQKESTEEVRPTTPPSQSEPCDRKASVSSSESDCPSEDERL